VRAESAEPADGEADQADPIRQDSADRLPPGDERRLGSPQLSAIMVLIRLVSACIVNGLVSTCMPGSSRPLLTAAFAA
jgi:hypothetical protein